MFCRILKIVTTPTITQPNMNAEVGFDTKMTLYTVPTTPATETYIWKTTKNNVISKSKQARNNDIKNSNIKTRTTTTSTATTKTTTPTAVAKATATTTMAASRSVS